MDNEIYSEGNIVSIDKMIYPAIYEIRHSLSKHPDEKIIFSLVKEFLAGNKTEEFFFFRERLRTLKIVGKIINKFIKEMESLPFAKKYSICHC